MTVDLSSLDRGGVGRLAAIISSQVPLAAVTALRADLTSVSLPGLALPIPVEPGVTAAVVAELYLRSGSTEAARRARSVGQGWVEGLAGVAREYGVDVDVDN